MLLLMKLPCTVTNVEGGQWGVSGNSPYQHLLWRALRGFVSQHWCCVNTMLMFYSLQEAILVSLSALRPLIWKNVAPEKPQALK